MSPALVGDSLPLDYLGSPKKCPSLCNRDRDGRTPLVNEKPSLYLVLESGRVSKISDGCANRCIPRIRGEMGADLGRG